MEYLTQGLKNPDGSPFRFTFFTRQLNTDMAIVENLYSMGHEIADHTISHAIDQKPNAIAYMHNLNKTGWEREVLGQRQIIAESTNIPAADIVGFRSPDLSLNDDLFEVMTENKFLYDSSSTVILSGVPAVDRPWGTQQIWPFSLDHGIMGCPQGTAAGCTTRSFPGLWELPINPILTLPAANPLEPATNSTEESADPDCNPYCHIEKAMYPFAGKTADQVAAGFQYNLKRNMDGDGAPFGIFLHTAWLSDNSTGLNNATLIGLRKFLSELPSGTVVLTPSEVIALMKKQGNRASNLRGDAAAVQLPTYVKRPPARCGFTDAKYCKGGRPTLWGNTCEYWWTCNATCPTSFPWLDNSKGADTVAGCYGATAEEKATQEQHRLDDYDPFRR